MIFFKKFKKINKVLIVLFLFSGLSYLISLIFFTHSVLTLYGIETLIRIILLVLFYLLFIIYFFSSLILLFTKKNKRFISISILALLFSFCFSLGAFYVDKTYNKIHTMNKETILYTCNMISLKDYDFIDNATTIVGMIDDRNDIEGYQLATKLISQKKLTKIEIKKFNNYSEMLNSLYSKEINALFISGNFEILFSEDFPTIKNDVKIVYSYSKSIEKDQSLTSNKKLTDPFSILLIGVDSTSDTLNANQAFNGDTLMLITFNPNTLNATVFSIPRDTYAPISCRNNTEAKINKCAYGGTSCIINTIQNFADINIDYYVKMNFKGVVKLVDALGGITVDIPKDLCEQNSDREFGKNTICLKKGVQELNGEEALAFARNRHAFIRGDFDRVKNQQAVVEAIVKSAKNLRSISDFYEVLDAVSSNMDTNITTKQILSFYEVGKDIVTKVLQGENDFITIEKTELTGYDLTINGSYTFQYYKESLEQISNLMKVNLEIKKPEIIKTFNFSINTPFEQELVGTKLSNTEKRKTTLPSFIGTNKAYVTNWNTYDIKIIYKEITEGNIEFDNTLSDGYIVNQNIPAGTLIENIKTIELSIIKK